MLALESLCISSRCPEPEILGEPSEWYVVESVVMRRILLYFCFGMGGTDPFRCHAVSFATSFECFTLRS